MHFAIQKLIIKIKRKTGQNLTQQSGVQNKNGTKFDPTKGGKNKNVLILTQQSGVKNKNGSKIDPTKGGKNKNELKVSQKVGVKVTD